MNLKYYDKKEKKEIILARVTYYIINIFFLSASIFESAVSDF